MNKRKLYYSRKRKRIVIEGAVTKHGKTNTIHIITLPDPLSLIKSWNLPKEKKEKILKKINRVGFIYENKEKKA